MSKFSYSDIESLGTTAEEQLNNIIALFLKGEILRIESGDALEGSSTSHNTFLIGSGKHEGLTLDSPLSTLKGASGAIVNRLVTVSAHTVLDNIVFMQDGDDTNLNHLVRVSGNSRVLFTNCLFQRRYDAPVQPPGPGITNCFVLVDSGSSATFQGCTFRSSHSTGAMNGVGTVVQNSNAAAAPALGPLPGVYVIGGMNLTTHNHGLTVTRLGGEV
jgi:hypothetical protein